MGLAVNQRTVFVVFKYVLHGCARFGAMHFCEALSLSVVMLEINSNWGGHG